MKSRKLAALIAALSIGISPLGIISASAQDAPVLKKKGAAQSEQQSGGAETQPPKAQTSGEQSQNGSGEGTGQSAQGGADSDSNQVLKPKKGTAAETKSKASGQSNTKTEASGAKKPAENGSNGSAASNNTGTKGQNTTETQNSGATDNQITGATTKTQNAETKNTTNVNITTQQQTEIRQVVKEVHTEPVRDVNFNVTVGTTVPKRVRLEVLPPRIVKIVPEYKGYRFFVLADGRIIIVDPDTLAIVYVLMA